MSENPLVSVIIPFFDEERFLAEAIEGVLAQTYSNWELLLIDDGSTDRSAAIARRYVEKSSSRARYLEHEGHVNRGHSASRNLGIAHAKGEYVAFLDADDVWLPDKLQQQVAIMGQYTAAAMVYGRTQFWHNWPGSNASRPDRFYTFGIRPDTLVGPPKLIPLLMGNRVQTASASDAMVRRRIFDEIGRFEETFRDVHEDYVFFAKVYAKVPVFVANRFWVRYRQHADSIMGVAKKNGTLPQAWLRFLIWLEKYLREEGVSDPALDKLLAADLHRCRHPMLHRLSQRRRDLWPAAKNRIRTAASVTLPPPLKRSLKRVWARKRARSPRVLILLYHRVVEVASDPYNMCVAPRHFEEHLRIIRDWGEVLSLSELARQLRRGRLPRRGFVVTFDDGYVDNLKAAKPLLERAEVPATIFVTSGAVGGSRVFWWDEIERALLRPGSLPKQLVLGVNGSVRRWELAEAAEYSAEQSRVRGWNAYRESDMLVPRQRFFQSVFQFISQLSGLERQAALDRLTDWAGINAEMRPDRRPLSPAELQELARGDLIEIGAHTVTHPALPRLLIDQQYSEMYQSKTQLEQLIGRPVANLAYPHGEFSADTLITAREAGFECACTTVRQPLQREAEFFQLPRINVEDWDGDQFARKLEEWYQR